MTGPDQPCLSLSLSHGLPFPLGHSGIKEAALASSAAGGLFLPFSPSAAAFLSSGFLAVGRSSSSSRRSFFSGSVPAVAIILTAGGSSCLLLDRFLSVSSSILLSFTLNLSPPFSSLTSLSLLRILCISVLNSFSSASLVRLSLYKSFLISLF